jgi:hypothetical protein
MQAIILHIWSSSWEKFRETTNERILKGSEGYVLITFLCIIK